MVIINKIKQFCCITLRIEKYKLLSDCKKVSGKPNLYHPLLLKGKGHIFFGNNVQMGVISAPNYYSHYSYFEVCNENSEIHIGNNVAISNAFSIECFSKVVIEDEVIIGVNCSILDNDGHDLDIDLRKEGVPKFVAVHICQNAFLGSNVTVLKGVKIGENSIIGNGSIVTKNIPSNVLAAGNPAKVIRNL